MIEYPLCSYYDSIHSVPIMIVSTLALAAFVEVYGTYKGWKLFTVRLAVYVAFVKGRIFQTVVFVSSNNSGVHSWSINHIYGSLI
jgi:hypothetical protein